MPVAFHRLATVEYVAARRRYARRSTAAATRFVDAFDRSVRLIDATPAVGAPLGTRFRWVRLRRYPYVLYYELIGPVAYVYAVAHTSRRPGYWLRRVNRP